MSDDMAKDIFSGIESVAKTWKTAKRQADKEDRISKRSLQDIRYKPYKITMKSVVNAVLENAYNIVSSNGKYYANARQLMYRVRPSVISRCGQEWTNSSYFTQTLLKDYLEYYAPDWKVVWDARGHFREPHTDCMIGLGGVEIIKYIDGWINHFGFKMNAIIEDDATMTFGTKGYFGRYGAVLFVEKEGFNEILNESKIGEEFDIAIMSTKGVPVGAACKLANLLDKKGVKIFVLHDFDFAGFKIINTLRTGTRLTQGAPGVIDLGFRYNDVKDKIKDGETEDVTYNQNKDPRIKLREYGATEEEQNFLVEEREDEYCYASWVGKRVELNVLTSEEFINYIRKKLKEHGVKKVIPDDDTLSRAYEHFVQEVRLTEKIKDVYDKMDKKVAVHKTLREDIEEEMKRNPSFPWDNILWDIAKENEKNGVD